MKAERTKLQFSCLLCAAFCLASAAACGVRAAPKPPTEPDEESRAEKILMNSVPESAASRLAAPSQGNGDISEGGKDGVEECKACELREHDLVN